MVTESLCCKSPTHSPDSFNDLKLGGIGRRFLAALTFECWQDCRTMLPTRHVDP